MRKSDALKRALIHGSVNECVHSWVAGEYEVHRCIDCGILRLLKVERREGEKVVMKEVALMNLKNGKISVKR